MIALANPASTKASSPVAGCEQTGSRRTFELARYNANITTTPKPSNVREGDLVEFNPNSMHDHAGYLRQVKAQGGLPEWYWVGVNCEKGLDCSTLAAEGVRLDSTGTAEWNKTEARIHNLRHDAVIARAGREMERALRAAASAGTDLAFRIDNMHDLDTLKFYDHLHVRDYQELAVMPRTWDSVVRRLRSEGVLAPGMLVGLTAHNNFAFWTKWIASGGTPPLVLRMENPTQFRKEFETGVALMQETGIPFLAIEFREGHGYQPTPAQLDEVTAKVSMLVLMENEDNYEDGTALPGKGPTRIVGRPCAP